MPRQKARVRAPGAIIEKTKGKTGLVQVSDGIYADFLTTEKGWSRDKQGASKRYDVGKSFATDSKTGTFKNPSVTIPPFVDFASWIPEEDKYHWYPEEYDG